MPSFSQEIIGDLNLNENPTNSKNEERRHISIDSAPRSAPPGLSSEQRFAFSLRDFMASNAVTENGQQCVDGGEQGAQALPYIDERDSDSNPSDEDRLQYQETEEVLNNAACRLRRWRAASRKLRRPRIIDNLSNEDEKQESKSGHTDLADRLRSLATLAPPPPAATAPSSPSCLMSPSLAYQSSADYFGSSPECCADVSAASPAPPPGPRYNLAAEGALRVCCFQHTRTVVDKILTAKFLRRWEVHVLLLQEDHIVSKTPSGLLEQPLQYSCMQEVYCISRWDSARKYCLRVVMPHGSLVLQANDIYTRDQWFHSIVWKRNIKRYRNIITNNERKEVVLKELKNMVDYVMTTPLQDESVTRAPMEILTDLLSQKRESPSWEEWAESATLCAAPLLAERGAGGGARAGELCGALARLCRRRPRGSALCALAPAVRRVLTRNVDFARAPDARRLVRDYVSALGQHNAGAALVRRFVCVTHGGGGRAVCPHPRAAPNLAAVALAALDAQYRAHCDADTTHVCAPDEDRVLCFASILEHMCEYSDWLVVVGAVLQPVPLCAAALRCERVAAHVRGVLAALARDGRCAAHGSVAAPPARDAARTHPPSWLQAAAPTARALRGDRDQLCRLWGDMLGGLLSCSYCKRKNLLQELVKQLPDLVLVALTEHWAALEALCLVLEWEVAADERTQLDVIATLQATERGRQQYARLCERQQSLRRLQAAGGPRRLALPVRATDDDVAALLHSGALGNLECLSLAFTAVTSACAEHLIKLPGLRYLNLWATQFGDAGLQLLAEHLPRLQVLNLCETPVSDAGVAALGSLHQLRRLNLNSTRLSAAAFRALRERLPQLQEYDVRYTEAW